MSGGRLRWVLIVAIVIGIAGFIAWPWKFLPLRWRYSNIRAAERVIGTIDDLQRRNGRYPTIDEVEFGMDSFGYETHANWYQLTVTEGFDLYYVYDSRDRLWRRLGTVPEK